MCIPGVYVDTGGNLCDIQIEITCPQSTQGASTCPKLIPKCLLWSSCEKPGVGATTFQDVWDSLLVQTDPSQISKKTWSHVYCLKPNLSFSKISPGRTLFQARHLRKFNGFFSRKQNPHLGSQDVTSEARWSGPSDQTVWWHHSSWDFGFQGPNTKTADVSRVDSGDHCCQVRIKESTHISDKFEHFWWFALPVFGLGISCLPVISMEENGNVFSSIYLLLAEDPLGELLGHPTELPNDHQICSDSDFNGFHLRDTDLLGAR